MIKEIIETNKDTLVNVLSKRKYDIKIIDEYTIEVSKELFLIPHLKITLTKKPNLIGTNLWFIICSENRAKNEIEKIIKELKKNEKN